MTQFRLPLAGVTLGTVFLLAGTAFGQLKPAPSAPSASPGTPPAASPDATAASPTAAPAPSAETAPTPAPGVAPPPPGAPAAGTPANGPPPTAPPAGSPGSTLSSGPYTGPPLLFVQGKGKPNLGAYGGLGVSYTHMLHRDGAIVDLAGSILVDHRFSLGLGLNFFTRTPNGPSLVLTPREYRAGYLGAILRYAVYGDFPVYASIGALVGGGTLALVEDFDREHNPDYHHDSGNTEVRGFFVFQPDIALHVNATRWLRFTLTGGYRVATSVNDFGYDAVAMSGAVVGGKVELGWF